MQINCYNREMYRNNVKDVINTISKHIISDIDKSRRLKMNNQILQEEIKRMNR